jgi:ABC-2 type transport system permease protein
MIPIIFVMPIVQMLVLVYAATFEMKNISFSVVDHDGSKISRGLVQKMSASPFFTLVSRPQNEDIAEEQLLTDKTNVVLVFPTGFESKLVRENKSEMQILINAINGTVAGLSQNYISQILMAYNKDIIVDYLNVIPKLGQTIVVKPHFWYNLELNYKVYMVPGILVILVTVIGMFLSGLNLVREKEIGTIEQINVTPIKKYQFIIGKLLPFMLIGLFDLFFGLTIGKILFHLPMLGSLFTLFIMAILYLIVVLGAGLLISTFADTQQQMMFIGYFFILIFILMSGIFTPTESMPQWAQYLNLLNPIYYFMSGIRMILLKGSGFKDLAFQFYSLIIYGISIVSLAVWKYRKVN